MVDPFEQIVKAQRIDFIVQSMITSKIDGRERELLDVWLGELTADLVFDLLKLSKDKEASKRRQCYAAVP